MCTLLPLSNMINVNDVILCIFHYPSKSCAEFTFWVWKTQCLFLFQPPAVYSIELKKLS